MLKIRSSIIDEILKYEKGQEIGKVLFDCVAAKLTRRGPEHIQSSAKTAHLLKYPLTPLEGKNCNLFPDRFRICNTTPVKVSNFFRSLYSSLCSSSVIYSRGLFHCIALSMTDFFFT